MSTYGSNFFRDSPTIWSVASVFVRSGGALITLPLALTVLSAGEIGLYYVFLSLIALSQLLDFGFNQTFARFTAQAHAGATEFVRFGIPQSGRKSQPNTALLKRLVSASRGLYAVIGALVAILVSLVATPFISGEVNSAGLPDHLIYCWLSMTIASGLSLYSEVWRTALFGVGKLKQAHQVTICAHSVAILVTFTGLLTGFGLWSFAAAKLIYAMVNAAIARKVLGEVLDLKWLDISWQTDLVVKMWPTAWRQGALSIGEFLMTRSLVLVFAALFGLELASKYGLSTQIFGVLGALCTAPLAVMMPVFNKLRVQASLKDLRTSFLGRTYLGLSAFVLFSLLVFLLLPSLLESVNSNTSLLENDHLLLLFVACLLNLHQNAWVSLVLTENRNPFVLPILFTGLATIGISYLMGKTFGISGLLIGQLIIPLLFINWWPVVRGLSGLAALGGRKLDPSSRAN